MRGPFLPEACKVTPEPNELFVHVSQLLDKSSEGLLMLIPGFAAGRVSGQLKHLKVVKNWTNLYYYRLCSSTQAEHFSTLVPEKENIGECAMKAM